MRKIKQGKSGPGLPSIGLHTPRSYYQQKSTYLHTLDHQLSTNIQYETKGTDDIGQQHKRLRNLLRKINEQTIRMVSSIQPKHKKQRKTTTSVLALKDKQSQNNMRILQTCKIQIQKLKQQQNHIQSNTKQTYDSKINELAEEIDVQRAIIKQILFENEKRGKRIVNEHAITYQGQLKTVETDKSILQVKLDRLRYQNTKAKQQITELNKKSQQIQQKYNLTLKKYKLYQQTNIQEKNKTKNQIQYHNKKQKLSSFKKKSEFYQQNNQYKYYRELQKLQKTTKSIQIAQEQINQKMISIQATKTILEKLEERLTQLRRKKLEKENQLNQFLQQTKNQIFNRQEMPSQINHKSQGKEQIEDDLLQSEVKENQKNQEENQKSQEENQKSQEEINEDQKVQEELNGNQKIQS